MLSETGLFRIQHWVQEQLDRRRPDQLVWGTLLSHVWVAKGLPKGIYPPGCLGTFQGQEIALPKELLHQVTAAQLISLYEHTRRKSQRHQLGAFYTPPELVDYILDQTLEPLVQQAGPFAVTLIDPACGCGAFLVPAYRRFAKAYGEMGVPPHQIPQQILTHNIYGIDLDQWALVLATLALLETPGFCWDGGVPTFNLVRGDGLLPQEVGGAQLGKADFTVVVGNPPHVTNYARRSQRLDQEYIDKLKEFFRFSRQRVSNRYNLTMFFLERSLQLTGPRGRIGLVIDGSGFQTTVYREIRQLLREEITVLQWVEGLEAFPGVNNRQAILVMEQKKPTPEHRLTYSTGLEGHRALLEQERWGRDGSLKPISPVVLDLLAKMDRVGVALGQLYRPLSGMNVTNRPEAETKPFLSQEPYDATYHKTIFSGNVTPYVLSWPTEQQRSGRGRKRMYISYDREQAKKVNTYLASRGEKARVSIGASPERFRQPKLFVRQSLGGDRMMAAAYSSDPDHYCDNSAYVINQLRPDYDLFYLLTILNSTLLTFYAREKGILSQASRGSATRLPMGRGEGKGLRDLPIPPNPEGSHELSLLGQELTGLGEKLAAARAKGNQEIAGQVQHQMARLQGEAEEAVCRLYDLTYEEVELVQGLMGEG